MKRLDIAGKFIAYLGRYRYQMAVGTGCFLITAFVFFLCRLPLAAVLYAWLLCGLLVLAAFLAGFCRYLKRLKVLEAAAAQPAFPLDELPEAEDELERNYQLLLHQKEEEKNLVLEETETARRELNDYYTMWVHQIKTPIAAMHLLIQSGEPLKASKLGAELFKIEQYVGMVLQYLRIESPDHDLVLQECDLDAVVRQAVRKYARTFIGKKLALDYGQLDCTVLTDEKWLLFIVEQLLSNAVKYTREGGISIYMDPEQEKTLVIEDTGIGIAPEDLPRIFEKGYTGWNGRKDKKSTGIGLYLCKKVTDRLSHRIAVTSEVGKGTKVKLCLKEADLSIL